MGKEDQRIGPGGIGRVMARGAKIRAAFRLEGAIALSSSARAGLSFDSAYV
jgi:hypothetical protein